MNWAQGTFHAFLHVTLQGEDGPYTGLAPADMAQNRGLSSGVSEMLEAIYSSPQPALLVHQNPIINWAHHLEAAKLESCSCCWDLHP